MQLRPMPIGSAPYYNIDPASRRTTVSDSCIDGYIDEAVTICRRGGLSRWLDLETGAPGSGVFFWHQMDRLVAVSGGRVWLIDHSGNKVELAGAVLGNGPIVFADGNKIDGTPWLYMADGGYPVYTTGSNLTRLTSASGSPANVSHICWHSGRFLVNEVGTRKFYATDVNPATEEMDNAYFLASDNPLTAESRPDVLNYLGVSWEEILVWGHQGLEIWSADSTFFSPVNGAFSPVGMLAPYSVVEADNTVFALCMVDGGNKRAVVSMQGRTPQVISLPIEHVLNSYSVVEDAIAWQTKDSEVVLTFPTEGESWCYDYRNKAWYQWSKWDSETASRQEFLGRYGATAWGKTFMMSRVDGVIYEYTRSTFADDANILATEYITGWMGNNNSARMNLLRLNLKRGLGGNSGNEPTMLVRWRDNGNAEWKTPRVVSLGKQGKRQFHRDIWQLGSFTTRQFSFIITDAVQLALVNVETDVARLKI